MAAGSTTTTKPSKSSASSKRSAASGASYGATGSSAQKKGAEFLCKTRFRNPLPALPFAPKLLAHDREEMLARLTAFSMNAWMRRQPLPLLTRNDVGVPIDMVDMERYSEAVRLLDARGNARGEVDEVDRVLLDAPMPGARLVMDKDGVLRSGGVPSTAASGTGAGASGTGVPASGERYRPIVSWLRRTEYISREGSKLVGKNSALQFERMRAQQGQNVTLSHDDQIASIEESFAAAERVDAAVAAGTLRHPRDKTLRAVEVWPVFPAEVVAEEDDNNESPAAVAARLKLLHAYFDDDPAVKPLYKLRSQLTPEELEERATVDKQLDHAVLKAFTFESGELAVGLYLPSLDSVTNALAAVDNGTQVDEALSTVPLNLVRLYKPLVQRENEGVKFAFTVGDGRVTYQPVVSRVHFQKRRKKKQRPTSIAMDVDGGSTSEEEDTQTTVLNVKRVKVEPPAQADHVDDEEEDDLDAVVNAGANM